MPQRMTIIVGVTVKIGGRAMEEEEEEEEVCGKLLLDWRYRLIEEGVCESRDLG
jgi:hypothetical protein